MKPKALPSKPATPKALMNSPKPRAKSGRRTPAAQSSGKLQNAVRTKLWHNWLTEENYFF